jgi:hypothetical protein
VWRRGDVLPGDEVLRLDLSPPCLLLFTQLPSGSSETGSGRKRGLGLVEKTRTKRVIRDSRRVKTLVWIVETSRFVFAELGGGDW